MTSRLSAKGQSAVSSVVSAPPGAKTASFVLFASLAALLGLLYAAAEWWNLGGAFGFPSDAAWARAVFARNVASGNGLSFNPGVSTGGAAAPAWIACLAMGGLVLRDFILSAKLLGIACVVLSAYLVWAVLLDLLDDWRFAFTGALLVAASPRLVSSALSGTEASLAALLLVAVVHWQAAGAAGEVRPRVLAAGAAGLAALSRPELLLILPLLLLDRGLVQWVRRPPGARLRPAFAQGLPEMAGAALLLLPYLLYSWQAGGPAWQQVEQALRPQPVTTWAGAVLSHLWSDNQALFIAALLGLPVAVSAAVRLRSGHRSFLLVLLPLVFALFPGLLWRQHHVSNAEFAAAYLTPVIVVLAMSGLYLLYRAARQLTLSSGSLPGQLALAAGIGAVLVVVFGLTWNAHESGLGEHGFRVKKVSNLQGYVGRWAADHLPPDASIATRDVGAIGFFSRRRIVDLGGTVEREGLARLRQAGSPDANLLTYLDEVRPSHLAIRPGDFPDLSLRADLFVPAITAAVTDPTAGGATTIVLYQTPWPPLSLVGAGDADTP